MQTTHVVSIEGSDLLIEAESVEEAAAVYRQLLDYSPIVRDACGRIVIDIDDIKPMRADERFALLDARLRADLDAMRAAA